MENKMRARCPMTGFKAACVSGCAWRDGERCAVLTLAGALGRCGDELYAMVELDMRANPEATALDDAPVDAATEAVHDEM